MDNPFKSPAIISFCPGILGLERGLVRAIGKIRVIAYVEIEAYILINLVAGMEAGMVDPAPLWTDAKTFNAEPFRGRVHGIIGGYPCPGESLAGLREGHKYKGFIWPAIRKAVAAARPLWCFFENVDDHLTGTYPIVQRSLRTLGYRVEAGIFSAEEVGAPHERKRLFILALENTFSQRYRCQNISGEPQGAADIGARGELLAHPCSERYEGMQPGLVYRQGKGISRPITECRPASFPLGQGSEQRSWEHPRTTESSVGLSIDGYNFRNDLLRAAGNSVVEQTAEIAFINLFNKHMKEINS